MRQSIIERQLIELKANTPQRFLISGGIDIDRAIFEFRCHNLQTRRLVERSIEVKFLSNGTTFSTPVHFSDLDGFPRPFNIDMLTENNSRTEFEFIEFSSKFDITFEVFAYYEEVVFLR